MVWPKIEHTVFRADRARGVSDEYEIRAGDEIFSIRVRDGAFDIE
jgi:hypothetical protein